MNRSDEIRVFNQALLLLAQQVNQHKDAQSCIVAGVGALSLSSSGFELGIISSNNYYQFSNYDLKLFDTFEKLKQGYSSSYGSHNSEQDSFDIPIIGPDLKSK